MTIDLIARRLEQRLGFRRVRSGDGRGRHHPNADAFLTPRVQVARMIDRQARIGGVQAAHVLVIEAAPSANEYLVERPLAFVLHANTPVRGSNRSIRPRSLWRASRVFQRQPW